MAHRHPEDVAGIVLAGGRSSRFGSDKASALLLGRPLLAWVATALAAHAGTLVVAAAEGQPLPLLDLPVPVIVVRDETPAFGPIGGLAAALAVTGATRALVAPCDAPLVRPAVLGLLLDSLGDADAACAEVGGRLQPLLAAVAVAPVGAAMGAAMAGGLGRVVDVFRSLKLTVVTEDVIRVVDPGLLSFHNANTAAEIEEIARLARQVMPPPGG